MPEPLAVLARLPNSAVENSTVTWWDFSTVVVLRAVAFLAGADFFAGEVDDLVAVFFAVVFLAGVFFAAVGIVYLLGFVVARDELCLSYKKSD
jgi:hypothetical protein